MHPPPLSSIINKPGIVKLVLGTLTPSDLSQYSGTQTFESSHSNQWCNLSTFDALALTSRDICLRLYLTNLDIFNTEDSWPFSLMDYICIELTIELEWLLILSLSCDKFVMGTQFNMCSPTAQ